MTAHVNMAFSCPQNYDSLHCDCLGSQQEWAPRPWWAPGREGCIPQGLAVYLSQRRPMTWSWSVIARRQEMGMRWILPVSCHPQPHCRGCEHFLPQALIHTRKVGLHWEEEASLQLIVLTWLIDDGKRCRDSILYRLVLAYFTAHDHWASQHNITIMYPGHFPALALSSHCCASSRSRTSSHSIAHLHISPCIFAFHCASLRFTTHLCVLAHLHIPSRIFTFHHASLRSRT